jgi:serine/threonine-protein kinase RsbW
MQADGVVRGPASTVYRTEATGTPSPMGNTTQTGPGEFHLSLACEPASVPEARTRLRDWFDRLRLAGDRLMDIQLAVSEAVANVVRHAGCDHFDLTACWTAKGLTVSVSDPGPGLPQADRSFGVGREIIRKLATSVDFEETTPGTRVTMRFDRLAFGV